MVLDRGAADGVVDIYRFNILVSDTVFHIP